MAETWESGKIICEIEKRNWKFSSSFVCLNVISNVFSYKPVKESFPALPLYRSDKIPAVKKKDMERLQ